MGEVQEQKYICKICSKSCVSGKSLGGHMRVHLALISASKKAAKVKAKADIKMDCEGGDDDDDQDGSYQLKESPKDQSNSDCQNEDKITDSDQDADQNTNYELRENPKKSWRISDPKHGLNNNPKNGGASYSCKECGKEFPTLRALSGHMRSHSIMNKKKSHQCKKCGKGFDSMRAMFGHMKSHSKRSRVPAADESDDSFSDFDNLCPVRKKRSTIRYESAPKKNPCFSYNDLNESNMNEVAEILIMLSRGVRDWSNFDSGIEPSGDDDSVYFGVGSYGKYKNFVVNDGDFVCDADKDKNVSEFDGLGSGFVAYNVSNTIERGKLNEIAAVKLGSKDFLVAANATKEAVSEFVKSNKRSSSVQESGSENDSFENEANLEVFKGFERNREFKSENCDKIKKHECPVCLKVYPSGQALGGHKRAHYYSTGSFSTTDQSRRNREEVILMPAVNIQEAVDHVQVNNDLFDLNFPVISVDESGVKRDVGLSLWWAEMGHEHEALASAH